MYRRRCAARLGHQNRSSGHTSATGSDTCSVSPQHPYLADAGPVPIAHRGGSAVWPQNTMAAFRGAIELGYRHLETDVQATADGVLAIFHDDVLAPVADRDGRISEMSWSEVSQARVDGEPIPRLEELLDAFADVRISIDPKANAATEPLIEALRRPGVLDRVCIGSFSGTRLARVNQAFGDAVCLSLCPREIARLAALSTLGIPARSTLRYRRPFRGRIASIPLRQGPVPLATPRLIDYAHRVGLAVHVWTIDDAAKMARLLDLGIDGIMTDEPKLLLDVMKSRNVWPPDPDRCGGTS